jgi:hypothetical protein
MAVGTSICLIAIGAILRWALTVDVAGIDLEVVGLILMIAGALGLVIGVWISLSARRRVGPPRA